MLLGLPEVRPGDLITADLMNRLLREVQSLEDRLTRLEAGSVVTGPAAIGFVQVTYKSSPRGVQVVPGDPQPFMHLFTLFNSTNQPLTIDLTASALASAGDWSSSLQVQNTDGVPISSISVASGGSRDVMVAVVAPAGAAPGTDVTLTLDARVPAPHSKFGTGQVHLTVGAAAGPAVVRTVQFATVNVPLTDPNNAAPSTILTWAFDLRYAAAVPPLTGNFTLRVALASTPAASLGEWFVDFGGMPRTVESPGVVSTSVPLTAGAPDLRVNVRIRTPAAGAVDKSVDVRVTVASTDLPQATTADRPPFTIRVPHT